MPKKKILASPSSIGKIDNLPFDLLAKSNYEVIKNPFGRKLTIEETIKLAKDCVGHCLDVADARCASEDLDEH